MSLKIRIHSIDNITWEKKALCNYFVMHVHWFSGFI